VLRVVLKSAAGAGVEPRGRYTAQDGRAARGRDESGVGDDERGRHTLPVRLAVWVGAGVCAGVVSSVSASYSVGGAVARMRRHRSRAVHRAQRVAGALGWGEKKREYAYCPSPSIGSTSCMQSMRTCMQGETARSADACTIREGRLPENEAKNPWKK
jgi:hypothetical protein